MNQLGFHESIRLAIPGIVLCLGVSVVLRSMVGISAGISEITIIGVVVGITLAPVTEPLHRNYFSALVKAESIVPRVARIIRRKLTTAAGQRAISDEDAVELMRAYYASRYNDGELYSFRISKSYGVMYYNLSVAFTVGGLSGAAIITERPWLGIFLMAASLLLAVSSRLAARRHFLTSLDQELLFWKGKSADAVNVVFAAVEGLGGLR